MWPYPSADAAATGGDLEVSIQVFNGSTGEESLHHQQDAVDKESRSNPIDDILDYINPIEKQKAQKYPFAFSSSNIFNPSVKKASNMSDFLPLMEL